LSSLWPQLEDNENKQIKLKKFAFSLTAVITFVDFVATLAFVLCCRHRYHLYSHHQLLLINV
jgi:hypothetical protein